MPGWDPAISRSRQVVGAHFSNEQTNIAACSNPYQRVLQAAEPQAKPPANLIRPPLTNLTCKDQPFQPLHKSPSERSLVNQQSAKPAAATIPKAGIREPPDSEIRIERRHLQSALDSQLRSVQTKRVFPEPVLPTSHGQSTAPVTVSAPIRTGPSVWGQAQQT
jgi:hypothetical protein